MQLFIHALTKFEYGKSSYFTSNFPPEIAYVKLLSNVIASTE